MDKMAEFIRCRREVCEEFVAAGKAAEDGAGIPADDDPRYDAAWQRLQSECPSYGALKVRL